MVDITKMLQQKVSKRSKEAVKASAGGDRMRSYDLNSKKFSTVKMPEMFEQKKKKVAPKSKETSNINKSLKHLKRQKGAQK